MFQNITKYQEISIFNQYFIYYSEQLNLVIK